MPHYKKQCQLCGKEFKTYRGPNRPEPCFCSYKCYWKSGNPAHNVPNWLYKQQYGEKSGRKMVFIGRVDGKPKYIQRSHYVWNLHHPDDLVKPGEYIHHKDHDKSNDNPENLIKMNATGHQSYHANNITNEERSRRMIAYHRANPGYQRKGHIKKCPVCGKEFYRPPSAKAVTCSYKCMGKFRSMQKEM